MIAALIGEVFQKQNGKIFLNVNGVVYEVNVSIFTYESVKEKTTLFIKEIIKEDEYSLYGFLNIEEKQVFEKLLKINGVGAKVAMAICSTFTPSELALIVQNQDINALKKVPGIGPKSAKRILLEIGELDFSPSTKSEAIMALENLGFKKEQIIAVVNSIDSEDTATIVKEALKKISKGV